MRKQRNAPADNWGPLRDQIRNSKQTVGFGYSSVPGVFTIEARLPDMPYPLAIVWYRLLHRTTEIEILNSLVFERLRRCGLRTWLHKELCAAYPAVKKIVTEGGTESGLAWLRSAGFKRRPADNCWEYRVQGSK